MHFLILAQAAKPGNEMINVVVMLALMFGIMYFMMIRPQQRKEKERQRMVAELRAGQRVLFSGGLLGTIVEAKPFTFMIEISNGVRLEVARGAVSRILKDGDSAALEHQA